MAANLSWLAAQVVVDGLRFFAWSPEKTLTGQRVPLRMGDYECPVDLKRIHRALLRGSYSVEADEPDYAREVVRRSINALIGHARLLVWAAKQFGFSDTPSQRAYTEQLMGSLVEAGAASVQLNPGESVPVAAMPLVAYYLCPLGARYLKDQIRQWAAQARTHDDIHAKVTSVSNALPGLIFSAAHVSVNEPSLAERQPDRAPAREDAQRPAGAAVLEFFPGQVLFKGIDLNLPTGLPIDVLRNLADSPGRVVSHQNLHPQSTASEASDELRDAIGVIRKALEKHRVPYCITPKRREGYVLSQHKD